MSETNPEERRWLLLCVDLQHLGCVSGHGALEGLLRPGVRPRQVQAFLDRVHRIVVPQVRELQQAFRRAGLEVMHTRIQSLTPDGRDRSPEHRRLGLHAPPGSTLAKFLPGVEPSEGEIVLNKTASGVFVSTNIEYVLHNLGVQEIFVVGVQTNECVSSAVRSACDLGFRVTLVEDATAATTAELQRASVLTLADRYARIRSTEEILGLVGDR